MAAQAGRGIGYIRPDVHKHGMSHRLDKLIQEVNRLWSTIPDRAKILFAVDRFMALDPDNPIDQRLAHARSFIVTYRRLYGVRRLAHG